MAEYGFYYAGFGDCVRCFHCGIGLRTWTKDDYPWMEDARWSRECAYLGKIKGEEYVNRVHEEIEKEPKDFVPETSHTGQTVPSEEVETLLLTDAAQSVLQMDIPPLMIKRAIGMIHNEEGRSEITAQNIMKTTF